MNKTQLDLLSRLLPSRYDEHRSTGEALISQSPRIDAALKGLAGIVEYEPAFTVSGRTTAWRFRFVGQAALATNNSWGKCQDL